MLRSHVNVTKQRFTKYKQFTNNNNNQIKQLVLYIFYLSTFYLLYDKNASHIISYYTIFIPQTWKKNKIFDEQ